MHEMYNDIKEVLYSEEQLKDKVAEMGRQITADYDGKNPLLVTVLKGAVVYFTDLARQIDTHVEMDFMVVSSYGSGVKTSGVVKIVKDLDTEIAGRHVDECDALDDRTFGHFLWNGKKYRIKEIAELSTPTTAQTLAVYADRFYATQPCFTVNELGKGRCYYIAARTDADFLNDALKYMLDEAGLKPILPKLPEGTWATERYQEDGTRFVFIQNATHEKKTIALPKAMKDAASGKTIYEQLEMGELSVAVLTDE